MPNLQMAPQFDERAHIEMIYSMNGPIGFFSDLSKVEKVLLCIGAFLLCVGVSCFISFFFYALIIRLAYV